MGRGQAKRVTQNLHSYDNQGREFMHFIPGYGTGVRAWENYFKYVSCAFDQLNGRCSHLQAAAVGSMHGNANF